MAEALAFILQSLFEIDEESHEKLPDGRLKVIFVTTGINNKLVQLKTALWALFGIPVQAVDEVEIEELQAGPITRRYRVTVYLKPFSEGVRQASLGFIDTVLGRNVKYR